MKNFGVFQKQCCCFIVAETKLNDEFPEVQLFLAKKKEQEGIK